MEENVRLRISLKRNKPRQSGNAARTIPDTKPEGITETPNGQKVFYNRTLPHGFKHAYSNHPQSENP